MSQRYGLPRTPAEAQDWNHFVTDWLVEYGRAVPVSTTKLLALATARGLQLKSGARTLGRLLSERATLSYSGYTIVRRSWPIAKVRASGNTYTPPTWALVKTPIIRVRGTASDLIWPAAALSPVIQRIAALRDEPYTNGATLRLYDEQRTAAAIFGQAQGWRPIGTFPYERLLRKHSEDGLIPKWAPEDVFDHPDFFRGVGGDVAIVVHPYREIVPREIPSGVTIDLLPDSWWYPAIEPGRPRTVGYALRPGGSLRRPHQANPQSPS